MFVTLTLSPAFDCTVTVRGRLEWGRVHRVVAETETAGGKGVNVAKAIRAAGQPVWAGGLLGAGDEASFGALLAETGIRIGFHPVPCPTRRNQMLVDQHGRELKLNRPGFPDLAFDWAALRRYCLELGGRGEVVVLSGSLPEQFPDDTYGRLAALLGEAGKTVAVDCGGGPLAQALEAGPAVIKPNRAELEAVLGRPLADEAELVAAVRALARRQEVVVVSDGRAGAYFGTGGECYRGRPPEVKVVDTTGAGDTLLGQFCADYFPARRLTPEVVANAVAAGAAAVELRGTPVVPASRIRELAARVHVARL